MLWSAVIPSFLASMVEFVEALTLVLVVGVTVNWKSSLLGAASALVVLCALIFSFGTALVLYINIEILRIIVGIILVLFGAQWLKKALLRQSGLKAMHDEAAIFEREKKQLQSRESGSASKFNGFGFAVAFKSVLLEGLEAAFIVITFGTSVVTSAGTHTDKLNGILAASSGALAAFAVVVVMGAIIRGPLTKIPENLLKYATSIMLISFGIFWSGEGLGIIWPFGDLFIIMLIVFFIALSALLLFILKKLEKSGKKLKSTKESKKSNIVSHVLKEIFGFFCGDWIVFCGFAVTVAATVLLVYFNAVIVSGAVFILGISLSELLSLRLEVK